MNSFLKGFLSIFDWMFPRSLNEQMNDLDNQTQGLYDKMAWGLYINPWEVNKDLIDPLPVKLKQVERTVEEKIDDLINDLMKDSKTMAIEKLKNMLNERL